MRVTSDDILQGPLRPTLYRMIKPAVIGHLFLMSFGAVDTFFIGLMGPEELAAITFTMPINLLIYNLMFGLGIAISIIVGEVVGKEGLSHAGRASTASLLLCSIIAILISMIGYATIEPVFTLLGASQSTLPYIQDYMGIWYVFGLFLLLPVIGNSILRSIGDTRWPSFIMASVGLANAVLDPILIFGFGPIPAMGIEGAAIATVISWVLACTGLFWILCFRDKLIVGIFDDLPLMLSYWKKVLKVGWPISTSNIMTPISMGALTWLVASHGDKAVAGLGAGSRVEFFAMSVSFAMATSLSPFMAQNIGAGNLQRVRDSLYACIKFTVLFQLGAVVFFASLSPWLAQIFTSDPEVVSYAQLYLIVMPLGMAFYTVLMVFNTAFNSYQQSNLTLGSNMIRVFVFYIPLIFLGNLMFGLIGIFISCILANALGTLLGWYIYRKTSFYEKTQTPSPVPEPS